MVTILLDRERTLRYSFADELKLVRRCAGRGTLENLGRVNVGDAETFLQFMQIGLAHGPDAKIENDRDAVVKLIDAGLKAGTTKTKMVSAIYDALEEAGIITRDGGKAEEDGATAPTP